MLVLTRGEGQKIVVGGEIAVTVLEVRGSRVRLGIQSPDSVSIVRSEIWLEQNQVRNRHVERPSRK